MDLSIVVVNWNTRNFLERCLASVYETVEKLVFQLFVVDNASSDSSASMVRERFPQVQLVELPTNVGFAAANNIALRAAEGRYVLLLNPDTVVCPGALRVLVEFADTHPQAGAVGPLLLNPDGGIQLSCSRRPTLFREAWRLFHLERVYPLAGYPKQIWQAGQPCRVDVVSGACLLLRRAALQQVGGFDEDYFVYTEETDLCCCLKPHGWEIYWVPEARVIHYGGQSTQQVHREMFLQLYKSKVRFFRKQYGDSAALAYKRLLFAAALARVVPGQLSRFLPGQTGTNLARKASLYSELLRHLPGI